MKKYKRLISLLLALVLVCLSAVTAFAVDTEEELNKKLIELYNLNLEMFYAFGIGQDFYFPPEPGSQDPDPNWLKIVDSESAEETCWEALFMYLTYEEGRDYYDGEINLETATLLCDKMHEELRNIVIDRVEVEELVAICEKENNDNGYYDEELWNDFQSELAQAKELLADESIVDRRVNTAFYELMYQYDRLCASCIIYCDVDNDGAMRIMDATYVQRYLVGLETLNSAQMMILPVKKVKDVNIIHATYIQRYLVDLEEYDNSVKHLNMSKLFDNLGKADYTSDEFEYDSIRYNQIYYYFQF